MSLSTGEWDSRNQVYLVMKEKEKENKMEGDVEPHWTKEQAILVSCKSREDGVHIWIEERKKGSNT